VQGPAADLIKVAAERWTRERFQFRRNDSDAEGFVAGFEASRVCLVAQIHTERLFEVDADPGVTRAAVETVRLRMEGAAEESGLRVWTPVETSVRKTWAAFQPIEKFLGSKSFREGS
jgi:DNA polymerase I-like protein with 3'-5' exonuclease and polymerase domains